MLTHLILEKIITNKKDRRLVETGLIKEQT